jgi:hypothetical protein
MSATPPPSSPLPAHLRPVGVEIPATWTPEQALAVFELLDEIRDKIWSRYGVRLQDLLQEQRTSSTVDPGNEITTSPDRPAF